MHGKMFGIGPDSGKDFERYCSKAAFFWSDRFKLSAQDRDFSASVEAASFKAQCPIKPSRERAKEDTSFICQELSVGCLLSTSGLSESIIFTKSKTGFAVAVAVIRLGGSLGNFKFRCYLLSLLQAISSRHRVTVHLQI